MANIFAILTAVALVASAFLAFKNKEAYEKEIADRQTAENNLATSQARLTGLQEELAATEETRSQTEAETEVLREQQGSEETKLAGIRSDIEEKTKLSEENAARIQEIEDQTREIGEISELAPKITRLQEEIASLKDEKAQKEAMQSNLLSEKASTEAKIAEYQDINERIRRPESYFDSARVSAVYPQWGFVTLGSGVSSGVVAGSTLNVVRGGEVIGKLRVRSVEAGRASADVIPDTFGEDVRVRTGDRVVPDRSGEAQASASTN